MAARALEPARRIRGEHAARAGVGQRAVYRLDEADQVAFDLGAAVGIGIAEADAPGRRGCRAASPRSRRRTVATALPRACAPGVSARAAREAELERCGAGEARQALEQPGVERAARGPGYPASISGAPGGGSGGRWSGRNGRFGRCTEDAGIVRAAGRWRGQRIRRTHGDGGRHGHPGEEPADAERQRFGDGHAHPTAARGRGRTGRRRGQPPRRLHATSSHSAPAPASADARPQRLARDGEPDDAAEQDRRADGDRVAAAVAVADRLLQRGDVRPPRPAAAACRPARAAPRRGPASAARAAPRAPRAAGCGCRAPSRRRRCARASTGAGSARRSARCPGRDRAAGPGPRCCSSVFCSRISCGWISMSKRRAISNSRSRNCAEGDLLQRLVEDRLADRADGRLDLVDAGVGRHPAGLHVQLGHAPVVAVEEGQQVLGQVVLVARVERADDAEVHRDIARVRRVVDHHEDVAGVHVGVEEVVAEHLGEEDLHAVLRQQLHVHAAPRAAPAMSLTGMPWMRSITITSTRHQSQ